jgi:hypothetical protein
MGGNRPEGELVKKVRLVMGALGAAVPAVGMMVPPAASAAVQNPGKSVKTVGLLHQAAPAASSGASSSNPLLGSATFSSTTVHSGTPCTGTTMVGTGPHRWSGTGQLRYQGSMSTFIKKNLAGTWSCVGTVKGFLNKTAPPPGTIDSGWMRVRVRVNGTLVRTEWAKFNAGTGPRHPSKAVKQWHRTNMQVCVRYFWERNSNSPVGGMNQSPICFD